jgi:glycosyltransferase involved in cell wall biosynthesis
MRIAVVSTPFVAVPPRGYGGTELVVHELVRGLSAAGHDVTLFATGDSRARDLRYVYSAPVWPPDRRAELRHCAAAARAIAGERFDLVHAHTPAMLSFADELGAPLVYTIHHARDDRLTQAYRRRPFVRYVAISARQAELVPELACEVIHHGLDPERHPLGHGEGDYALFLGRLSPVKAPELAIAAARAANVAIRLAGELHVDDATPGWKVELSAALAQPGVLHVGPVSGERKMRLLGGARALLMPLRWEEPFGLVMIEAMMCGTPVVAFPRGAALEIVDEGITGFLVGDLAEMAAALARLDAFDRVACRRRAQARFGSARMVRAYERVYARAGATAQLAAGGAEESSYAG